jgi:two-component system response regulator DesR
MVAEVLQSDGDPSRTASATSCARRGRRRVDRGHRRDAFLSPATVRNYLSNAMSKLGARNRIEAIRIAREAAWL